MLWPVSLCSYVNDTPPYLPFLCPSLARQLAHVLNAFNNFTDTHTHTQTHTHSNSHTQLAGTTMDPKLSQACAGFATELCDSHVPLHSISSLPLFPAFPSSPPLYSVYQTSPPCSSSNKLRFKCKRSRNKMKQHLCLCSFFICHLSSTLAAPWGRGLALLLCHIFCTHISLNLFSLCIAKFSHEIKR